MHISRQLKSQLVRDLQSDHKIVILYGARQVGKTTLANHLLDELEFNALRINAEQTKYQEILASKDVDKLRSFIGDHDLLFIDEAQYIDDVGVNLKLIHDHLPEIKVLVTGSSSFDLSSKITEPLTGRAWQHILYPIAFSELAKIQSEFEVENQLEERLIFGSYPEVLTIQPYKDKQRYLQTLSTAYLFKDVFTFANIKHHSKVKQLLKLLAFQVGSEVSIQELAMKLGISRDAVNNYIDLLEKAFVIFRLSGFSRNLRKEITKMDKIYFYDLGVRNAVIDNFKLLNSRQDIGQLWENFLIAERQKRNSYQRHYCGSYFWRLHSGAELDYVEEYAGQLDAYEFKWWAGRAAVPKTWSETYPQSQYQLINQENYLDFVK